MNVARLMVSAAIRPPWRSTWPSPSPRRSRRMSICGKVLAPTARSSRSFRRARWSKSGPPSMAGAGCPGAGVTAIPSQPILAWEGPRWCAGAHRRWGPTNTTIRHLRVHMGRHPAMWSDRRSSTDRFMTVHISIDPTLDSAGGAVGAIGIAGETLTPKRGLRAKSLSIERDFALSIFRPHDPIRGAATVPVRSSPRPRRGCGDERRFLRRLFRGVGVFEIMFCIARTETRRV
jgi:hypothetical protein